MAVNNRPKKDIGLMIASGGIIIIGIVGMFFDLTYGSIGIFVGIGLFIMGLLGDKPLKRGES
ncbi:hypothetical protein [Spongiivirga citrea]|uniref:Uncharacterized protein n=1 Tax=Spongiivirga citrea TaxID=1481457 RepID=A0A6M0CVW8_9FLAO|nr:hypothetical protein [Spongiivirga citrea]NER17910.1 hypothetical protein [Spongiivirga citrea]